MRFSRSTTIGQPEILIDAVAEADDHVDIRLYEPNGAGQGQTLALDVNGITVFRIGRLQQEVELVRE